MISRLFIPLLMLVGAAAPFSVLNRRVQLFNRGGQMIQWEPRTVINSIDYPCPSEDFYPDPRNCSRFYQCVQFEVQGIIHSRYLFECLGGKVFDSEAKECVEGPCRSDETTTASPDSETTTAVSDIDPVTETTAQPSDTTVDPGAEQPGSETTTAAPDSPTTEDSAEPDPSTDEPLASTEEPVASTVEPDPTTVGSDATTAEPDVTTTASPGDGLIEHTPGGRLCASGRYIQHEKHCNFFQLCGEPNYYYACVAGTGFNEEFQMCRIAAQDEALCAGRPPLDMELTSASLLRQAFDWEEIGVLPDFDGSVFNAYPFVFTNIGVSSPQTTIYTADATPMITGIKRTETPEEEEEEEVEVVSDGEEEEESADEEESESEIDSESDSDGDSERVRETEIKYLGLPDGTSSGLKHLYDKYNKNAKTRNRRTKPVIKKQQAGPLIAQAFPPRLQTLPAMLPKEPADKSTDDITEQNDYQVLAALSDSPYNLINPYEYGLTGIADLQDESIRQAAETPFIIPYLNSEARIPQLYDSSSSLSPFVRQIPSSQIFGQLQGYRFPQASPFYSGLSPLTPLPFSAASLPYQPSQFSPIGIVVSPLASQVQPATQFSALNAFRNAIQPSSQAGYLQLPGQFGINSLPFPTTPSLGFRPKYDPYSILNLDNRDLSNLIQLSSISSSSGTQSTPQFQVKSPSIFGPSPVTVPFSPLSQISPYIYGLSPTATPTDVSAMPSFEARTSDGDVFEFTPVSDETVLALASQGLLDDKKIIGPDFSVDDLDNLDDGDVVLASIPVFKK